MIKQISVSFFIQFIFKNLWDHGLPWTCHMTWHSSRQALLKSCGSWSVVEDALQQLGLGQLEPFLLQNLGRHNTMRPHLPWYPLCSTFSMRICGGSALERVKLRDKENHKNISPYHHPHFFQNLYKLSDFSGLRLCPDFFHLFSQSFELSQR